MEREDAINGAEGTRAPETAGDAGAGESAAGREPYETVLVYLREGGERDEHRVRRAVFGLGDLLLAGLEVLLAAGILMYRDFHPLVAAGVALWGGLRVYGMVRRQKERRRFAESFGRGVRMMERRDYGAAAAAFEEALEHSRDERAALGYAYARGMEGDRGELLRGLRKLFRRHLYHRSAKEILESEVYAAVAAEPAFQAVGARVRDILSGEAEELLHVVPAVVRSRAIQIALGLVSFTLLALILTSVMTFL